tara:strand:- start:539 stop:1354 length:816 start_codon:yes stop_codon:yes gene_type:complete
MFDLQRILKALLFATNEPLSIKDVQAVITRYHHQADEERAELVAESGENAAADEEGQGVMSDLLDQVPTLLTSTQVREAMIEIASELVEERAPYRLQEGALGYRLIVAPDLADWVRLLRDEPRPQRFSPAQMETLAIVAYRQPVTRAEIEAIRGVSSDSALNRLVERQLVAVMGRAELPGRPLQFGTTDGFLEFSGLRSIEELPASDVLSPQQLSEWILQATNQEPVVGNAELGLADDRAVEEAAPVEEEPPAELTQGEAEVPEEQPEESK